MEDRERFGVEGREDICTEEYRVEGRDNPVTS